MELEKASTTGASASASDGNISTEPTETQKKLNETKAKVEEVVDIMRINVERIVERGQNLEDVDQRAEALKQSSLQFQQHSATLHNRQWWANLKWKIVLGVLLIILIILIVVWIVYG